MAFKFTIPQTGKQHLEITIEIGGCLFVLGANGSGKSSLMLHLSISHSDARRILAHRQTWFQTDAVTMSPENKRNYQENIRQQDRQPHSRWKEDYPNERTGIAVYDLIEAENLRARRIAAAVDAKNIELAIKESGADAPTKIINELFKLSNLPIEISVVGNERVVASKRGGPAYSIARLSDGERNALLMAAVILTSKPGTLFVIDEPERHLHRSIISPFLTNLFRKRSDCGFIVSTHEVMVPIDNPDGAVLLVRDCAYDANAQTVASWDVDLLLSAALIDDETMRDILGGRRKMLFIEAETAA